MSMELDELIEDESGPNFGSYDIQTHLSLAMVGVDDDLVSNNSPDQSVDLVHESRTLEDYSMDVIAIQQALIDLNLLL